MKQKCSNCIYYHGQQGVHCGIYPKGRPDRYCPDWSRLKERDRTEKTLKQLTPRDWIYIILTLYAPAFFCFVTLQKIDLLSFKNFTQTASFSYLMMALSHFMAGLLVKEHIAKLMAIANLSLTILFGGIYFAIH